METKTCSKCKIKKSIYDFNKLKSTKDGLTYQCKNCVNSLRKQNYYKNIDKELLRRKNNTEYLKEWREKNHTKLKEQKDRNKEKRNQYFKDRYHSKPENKIVHNLCARINKYIKLNKITKNNKSIKYIGCTPNELKSHLESQFTDGMSWDNYGMYGWHIDHIIPKSLIKTEEDLIKISHYTNLQPLWAKDNLSKGNKIL